MTTPTRRFSPSAVPNSKQDGLSRRLALGLHLLDLPGQLRLRLVSRQTNVERLVRVSELGFVLLAQTDAAIRIFVHLRHDPTPRRA